jgi:LAO/AO transport system kinase
MSVVGDFIERFRAGDRAALARAISWAENANPAYAEFLRAVYASVGRAWRTGITGPPGAGKSTLVNELARSLRARRRTVGILAVDPSSPISGGALLGDRIRMEERTSDAGVFIRSMASRGSHGGLSRAAADACDVLDAFGIDEVLLETVGVGQAEYDVVSATDTVLVVLCPGAGDGIQAMKAGILEVADVLVVNKVDLPGSDRLRMDLEEAAHVRHAGTGRWVPPVVGCSAGKSEGIDDVFTAIDSHREHLKTVGLDAARGAKRVAHVQRVLEARLAEELWGSGGQRERAQSLLQAGRTPYEVVDELAALLADSLRAGR